MNVSCSSRGQSIFRISSCLSPRVVQNKLGLNRISLSARNINTTTTTTTNSSTTNKMAPSQSLPQSMPAWHHRPTLFSAGPLEKTLNLNQVAPVPKLKANQTLVRVLTAGINPVDYKLGELPLLSRFAVGSPSTPGIEYVGRVWSTTLPDSAGIKAGDLVFGNNDSLGGVGTLAGYTVVPGTEGIVKVPRGVEEIDWFAGLGVAGLTAYQSLIPNLETGGEGSARGKSVFINGSSGGVGTFGVQIARILGCSHIVVTCSSANADLVRSLGATRVIDYRQTDVVDALKSCVADDMGGTKFDLVVDNAGADMSIYWHSHHYLREGAKYCFVGAGISLKTLSDVSKIMLWPGFLGGGKRKFEFLALASKKHDYERLAAWIVDGQLKVLIDSTWEMNQAPDAYRKLKTGRARGKIVVRVSNAEREQNRS